MLRLQLFPLIQLILPALRFCILSTCQQISKIEKSPPSPLLWKNICCFLVNFVLDSQTIENKEELISLLFSTICKSEHLMCNSCNPQFLSPSRQIGTLISTYFSTVFVNRNYRKRAQFPHRIFLPERISSA